MPRWYDRLVNDRWERSWLQLCVLAPIAGLMFVGSWAVFLVFAHFAMKAMFWWVQKSNESLESWLIWGVAPFVAFGILSFIWTVIDLAIYPWIHDIWSERRRRRS